MGKAKYSCPFLTYPKIWHDIKDTEQQVFMWVYPDYKCRMLSIRKIEEGKYLPLVNGSNDFRNVPEGEKFYCNSLEESKQFLFNYIEDGIKNDIRHNKEHLKGILKSYVDRSAEGK